MWLSNSSVGRKFVMALTGACLFLFVTFHCLMNAVCIFWPTAYNVICEFLGANWYALAASAGLALLIVIHIILACCLTVQNRNARGNVRYSIEKRPATVEWSSKNMFVLGIVILAFLAVHMVQFWAKMQLVEVSGCESLLPPTMGTLFIQEAFSQWWTPVIYIIGFVALWFHMNHGFWSMFQSVGWTNNLWIPRLRCIGCVWTTLVILCFVVQACVFTYHAQNDFYKTNPELREQYKDALAAEVAEEMPQLAMSMNMSSYDEVEQAFADAQEPAPIPSFEEFSKNMKAMYGDDVTEQQLKMAYAQQEQNYKTQMIAVDMQKFFNYLNGKEETKNVVLPQSVNR